MSNTNLSNLVERNALRKVQLEVLKKTSSVISKTAGPFGSYSMLMHQDRLTEYTKDGHKVLSNFRFYKPLETAVHDELLGITEHVVKKVGDGTTTAVQLSYLIYSALCDKSKDWELAGIPPYRIIVDFQDIVRKLTTIIREKGRECTLEDIKQICLISTNGNEMVSEDIYNIYKQFGNEVYIQIGTSNTESSIVKTYDGIIMDKGFQSASFVNTPENTCEIYSPRIYYFADPVDTPEMIQLFMTIFTNNIYIPYQQGKPENYVPTIIIAPTLSRDMDSSLADIEKIFYAFDQANRQDSKPPFCIIAGVNDRVDNIGDIITLCGCPLIKKYINPDQRLKDIEDGNAPSKDNVCEFYGTADLATVSVDKVKFVNPAEMFDKDAEIADDGSRPFSTTYNSLINFLKNQINIESLEKNNINTITVLKKRLHSLTANFVEYDIGGVSAADRDSIRDLVEDAVLNCRSAAEHGVGYGAGLEGLLATMELKAKNEYTDSVENITVKSDIIDIIMDSYKKMILNLYKTGMTDKEADSVLDVSVNRERVYNLRERSFEANQVLCSIETDIVILNAISKIITIMYTTNQAFLIDPLQNAYIED